MVTTTPLDHSLFRFTLTSRHLWRAALVVSALATAACTQGQENTSDCAGQAGCECVQSQFCDASLVCSAGVCLPDGSTGDGGESTATRDGGGNETTTEAGGDTDTTEGGRDTTTGDGEDGTTTDDGDDGTTTDDPWVCDPKVLPTKLPVVDTGMAPVNDIQIASCGGLGNEAVLSFTPTISGTYSLSTDGSEFDTVLYVRNGDCHGPELACDDDGGTGTASLLTLPLTAGEEVTIFVDSYDVAKFYVLTIDLA